jgi:hypothetical protein
MPNQAYNRIPKNVVRELVNLEPRSTLQVPFVNDLKKEYVKYFAKIVSALEVKFEANFGMENLKSLLDSIIIRDYFQNFRDPALINPSVMMPGKILRSAQVTLKFSISVLIFLKLHAYSSDELTLLFNKTKLQTIIDMRTTEDAQTKAYDPSIFQYVP